MRVTALTSVFHLPTIVVASGLVLLATQPAVAGSRSPAPIVFKGQSPSTASAATSELDTVDRSRERIRFSYPSDAQPSGYASIETEELEGGNSAGPKRTYASIEMPTRLSATPGATDFATTTTPAVEASSLPAITPAVEKEQGGYQPQKIAAVPARTPSSSVSSAPVFDESGMAVVYGDEFAGIPTANGEMFSQDELTAAHPNLPLPSLVQVVNLDTGQEVVVRVNDRGPYVDGAALQVSQRAAQQLGMSGAGHANVKIRYLGAAPAQMTSSSAQMASYSPAPDMAPTPSTASSAPAAPAYTTANYSPATTYAPAPAPAMTGNYYVQIGAFSDIANAQFLKSRLGSEYSVTIEPARVNGADFFRVRVGPQLTRNDAEAIRARLMVDGFSGGRIVETS